MFPYRIKVWFKYHDGLSKGICITLKLVPKHGPHLATAGNQNTGIDLSFFWILPLHHFYHDTSRY